MDLHSKIFVAGHRGLVGSAVLRRLQAEGFTHIITRTHAELDLTDSSAVTEFFEAERPEYVFLAAAKVGGIHANRTYPADFIRENLLIQTHVIHAAWSTGCRKLLFLGSSCIYPRLAPQPMREEYLLGGPLESTNQGYAIAKIAGILMCQAYRKQYGLPSICLMPTNLYGPNDNFDLETSHVLPALIRKFHLARRAAQGDWEGILRDETRFGPIPADFLACLAAIARDRGHNTPPKPYADRIHSSARGSSTSVPAVILWGTGSPRREFLHVDDLADACLYFMRHYEGEEIINVGVGKDASIREMAEMVREVVGFDGEVEFDPSMPDGTPRKLLDVSRLEKLGWRARIPLKEGIRSTYHWYLQQL